MSSKTQQQQVPQNTKKATEVHQQVEEVIGIMHNNIDKVVQRGEKLDSLQNKTEELQQGALSFKKTSNTVSNQMWWKDMKLNLIVGVVGITVVSVVVISILKSTGAM